ncbi:MAG: hypothetical protein MI923_22505 [Phycisphaerales bacterium]|nr:hypothetical protein [Phycisphaerales bacterium]
MQSQAEECFGEFFRCALLTAVCWVSGDFEFRGEFGHEVTVFKLLCSFGPGEESLEPFFLAESAMQTYCKDVVPYHG